MKKSLLFLTALLLLAQASVAQVKPVEFAKKANHFLYEVYDYGETIDTSQLWVALYHDEYQIAAKESHEPHVPGYAREVTIVNLKLDSTYLLAKFTGPLIYNLFYSLRLITVVHRLLMHGII